MSDAKKYDEWVFVLRGGLLIGYGVLCVIVTQAFTNSRLPYSICPEWRLNIWLFFQSLYIIAMALLFSLLTLALLYYLVLPVYAWDASLFNDSSRMSFLSVFALGLLHLVGLILGKSTYLSMDCVKGTPMILLVMYGKLDVFEK